MIKDGDSGKSVFKAGVFRQFGAQVRRPEQLNPHQRVGLPLVCQRSRRLQCAWKVIAMN